MELLNGFIDLADKYRQPVVLPSLAHKIVFALANVCMEESWEILLLVSNEYLNGATRMLRGLYERALTLTYISHHPEKAQRFIDYGTIQEHRIIEPALKLTTESDLDDTMPGCLGGGHVNDRVSHYLEVTAVAECSATLRCSQPAVRRRCSSLRLLVGLRLPAGRRHRRGRSCLRLLVRG